MAVRRVQHSERLGQPALSQTVSSPSSSTRLRVNDMPPAAGIGRFSHSGSRAAHGLVRHGTAAVVAVSARHRQARQRDRAMITQDWERRHAKEPCRGSAGAWCKRGAAQSEDLLRACGSGPRGPWTWPCAAGGGIPSTCGARGLADPGLIQHIEEIEIGSDVERQPMVGDPAVHGDADRGDPGRPGKDAGQSARVVPRKIEFLEDPPDGRVQPVQISLHGQSD